MTQCHEQPVADEQPGRKIAGYVLQIDRRAGLSERYRTTGSVPSALLDGWSRAIGRSWSACLAAAVLGVGQAVRSGVMVLS
jgi:hypothetical protein